MDGKPFRFIAGSFHYFRALPETWQRKLRTMRAAGLNAVTTYVEWSLHQPYNLEGHYIWEGIANLEKFIQLAKKEDLYIILRPGPHISAERDFGGFPYWILTKYPNIALRTYDEFSPDYRNEVYTWFNELLTKIVPYLYGNGGPVIMVQIENDYGSLEACDMRYRKWLRDVTESYIKDKALLFTTDQPSNIECGQVEGVFTTIKFGPNVKSNRTWNYLRKFQRNGPLLNSEFYTGWYTNWEGKMRRTSTKKLINGLVKMLDQGASVNFYMFFGGTNFGFTSGANMIGDGHFKADITSYDYDAPMDEAGDPTPKYMRIRETIGRYLPLPNISIPKPVPKKYYGSIKLTACCNILSEKGKHILSEKSRKYKHPLAFEELDTNSGLVLYETVLQHIQGDPAELLIEDISDRGYIYINGNYIGVLSRAHRINSIPISAQSGDKLQILVENQGRINYNSSRDLKGILSYVLLDGKKVKIWKMYTYPFNNYSQIELFMRENTNSDDKEYAYNISDNLTQINGPLLFHGHLYIENGKLGDTYLDTTGWGKGIAFMNGFNLGRYWPAVGPQITLYVPRELLKIGYNRVLLFEYQMAPVSGNIVFSNVAMLEGHQIAPISDNIVFSNVEMLDEHRMATISSNIRFSNEPMLDGFQVKERKVFNRSITYENAHINTTNIFLYSFFFIYPVFFYFLYYLISSKHIGKYSSHL